MLGSLEPPAVDLEASDSPRVSQGLTLAGPHSGGRGLRRGPWARSLPMRAVRQAGHGLSPDSELEADPHAGGRSPKLIAERSGESR